MDLSCDFQAERLPLLDVVMFILTAEKSRQEQKKHRWGSISNDVITRLWWSCVYILADMLEIFIWSDPEHYWDQDLPLQILSICIGWQFCFANVVNHSFLLYKT